MPRRAETILTDTAIRKLRPAAQRYEVRDASRPGFGVRVELDGRKVFFQRFGAGRAPAHARPLLASFRPCEGESRRRQGEGGPCGRARSNRRQARAPARRASRARGAESSTSG